MLFKIKVSTKIFIFSAINIFLQKWFISKEFKYAYCLLCEIFSTYISYCTLHESVNMILKCSLKDFFVAKLFNYKCPSNRLCLVGKATKEIKYVYETWIFRLLSKIELIEIFCTLDHRLGYKRHICISWCMYNGKILWLISL